jgi:hypothetical protein
MEAFQFSANAAGNQTDESSQILLIYTAASTVVSSERASVDIFQQNCNIHLIVETFLHLHKVGFGTKSLTTLFN